MRNSVTAAFKTYLYQTPVQDTQFLAMCLGDFEPHDPILVRVHGGCIGDVFNSRSCDCGPLLRESLRMIERDGRGVLLYVLPGNVDLRAQFCSHVLHRVVPRPAGGDTAPLAPAVRDFGLGAQVLVQLGLRRIRLLTNNPKRMAGLTGYGLEIVDRVPVPIKETRHNVTFLDRKRQRGELATGEGTP